MPKTSTHQLLSHQAVKRLNVYPSPLWIHGRWSPGWCPGPPLFPKDAESTTEKPETSRNLGRTPAPCFSLMATLDVYPWGLDNETHRWKIRPHRRCRGVYCVPAWTVSNCIIIIANKLLAWGGHFCSRILCFCMFFKRGQNSWSGPKICQDRPNIGPTWA